MSRFPTRSLPEAPDVLAPDGMEVRLLGAVTGGSAAMFTLPPGQVARAVTHRTVEEVWYILSGQGEMWRGDEVGEEITAVGQGVSLTIPLGVRFQLRNTGKAPLSAIALTTPPWPGEDEAILTEGPWTPTV